MNTNYFEYQIIYAMRLPILLQNIPSYFVLYFDNLLKQLLEIYFQLYVYALTKIMKSLGQLCVYLLCLVNSPRIYIHIEPLGDKERGDRDKAQIGKTNLITLSNRFTDDVNQKLFPRTVSRSIEIIAIPRTNQSINLTGHRSV